MKIAFYIEPWIEMQNPQFRLGAFTNVILKQAEILDRDGHEITLFTNDNIRLYIDSSNELYQKFNKIHISQNELSKVSNSYYEAAELLYNSTADSTKIEEYCQAFRCSCGNYKPDIIISWESLTSHLKNIYPDALILHMMPGIFSRLPFPQLISFDTEGLFKDSVLVKDADRIISNGLTIEEKKLLEKVREHYFNRYLTDHSPFKREIERHLRKFNKSILVPLQVSGYFAYDQNCGFKNQFDFLIYALERIPSDVGVLVTQYFTHHTKDIAITEDNIAYINDRYKNVFFDTSFNKVDGISQYLMSLVDGVMTVSSSIGLQSLLWEKPIFTVGHSHLSSLCHGQTTEDIRSALNSGYRKELDAVAAFILCKMHPMSSDYLYSGNNLSRYITSIYNNYKMNMRGFELYQPIHNIDRYARLLIEKTKFKRAIVKLTQESFLGDNDIKEIKSFASRVSNIRKPSFKIVSFDIFDTLLVRPYSKPVDLFKKLDSDVSSYTNGRILNFHKLRQEAEKSLRNEKGLSKSVFKEIKLNEIYDRLNALTNNKLSSTEINYLIDLEISEELSCLYPRESGMKLFREAVRCGKRVIIVSDMYLPESAIVEILNKNGIVGYEKLFLSSTIGLRKHEGDLFKYVTKDLKVKPEEIIHIGDNEYGDIQMAKENGYSTLWTPRTMELFYKNKKYNKLFWRHRNSTSISESVVISICANKFYDDPTHHFNDESHFNGDTYNLGYFGLGWLMLAYTKWLIETAIKDKIDTLFFLSRDGEIMMETYNKLSSFYPLAPKAKYLYCSRRAARVASISSENDIIEICNTSFSSGVLRDFFLNKFNIDICLLSESVMANYGFNSVLDEIKKQDIPKIISFALGIKDFIYKNSSHERVNYNKYLDDIGFTSEKSSAVVDIGYAGSMQAALKKITQREVLTGYYLLTFAEAKDLELSGNIIKGFCGDFLRKEYSWHPICRLGLAFEVVFSSKAGSFIKMALDSDGMTYPILESTINEGKKKSLIDGLRAGSHDFIDDFCRHMGYDLARISFDNQSCLSVYVDYLDNPSLNDVNIMHEINFDDNFSLAGEKYMIPPITDKSKLIDLQRKSVWKKGTEVLFKSMMDNKKTLTTPIKSTINAQPAERALTVIDSEIQMHHRLAANKFFRLAVFLFGGKSKYRKLTTNPTQFFLDSKHF
ncbi:HAD-IA family hydrolase [Aeromonas veronii]